MNKKEKKVRFAPHSKESEMMVLGSMLTSIGNLNIAVDLLLPSDFYYTEHQTIFDILKGLYHQDKPADIHIVSEILRSQEKLEEVGGVSYLTLLAQYAGTSAYMEEYAKMVKEKSLLRKMIEASQDIERKAFSGKEEASSLLDEAQAHFFHISQTANCDNSLLLSDILSGAKSKEHLPYLKLLEERQKTYLEKGADATKTVGLPSRFLDVDKMIHGFSPSNLMILAARPAMGKCVTGDTLILDPKTGLLHPIKELVEKEEATILSFTQKGDFEIRKPSAFLADGIKPTFVIKTASGKTIEATATHPFLTPLGWKAVKDLREGEKIASPRSLPYFGKAELAKEEIKMAAFLIAQPSFLKGFSFSLGKKALSTDFYETAKAFSYEVEQRKEKAFLKEKKTTCTKEPFLSPIFSYYKKERKLPPSFFELKKSLLALFLSRFFSAHLSLEVDFAQKKILLDLDNKPFLKQIQHLLLRFGILSLISLKALKMGFRPQYQLIIEEEASFALFFLEISLLGKNPTFPIKPPKLEEIFFEPIIALSPTGNKEVYDLCVETTHNFIAADLIVHNTALLLNFAENVCFKNDVPVGIFSLEMDAQQIIHRIVCSQSGVESDKILSGSLNGMEYQSVVTAVRKMQKHTMLIDDQPGLKITDLRARARRMKETHDIGFLLIDYLQLLSGSGNNRSMESRQMEVSEISRLLKTLARELNIPVLVAAQLSRKVEERQGHRPQMSDLRESGCLNKDALIQDAQTNQTYSIEELALRKTQTPFFVHAVDDSCTLGEHKLVKAFYSGIKQVYELKTVSGKVIRASANHPFRTKRGWVRLDELKENEPLLALQEAFPSSSNALVQEKISTKTKLFWDPLLSLEKLGEEKVYDVTVEGVHNFATNGLIVHNSLEQDADLIMFLLRRDYYNPQDNPGLAELIIGKNRHGGTGTVNLLFRKELGQFKNYIPLKEGEVFENEAAFDHFS